jgi:hypothetical protein
MLSQDQIGKDAPIAYASRRFNKAEKNYSTSAKELVGTIWRVKHTWDICTEEGSR